jgi:L-arabinose transport system permease protein
MLVILILAGLAACLFVPNFFTLPNFIALGLKVAAIGMISCSMMFCLASGDFDLSVGSVAAFAGVGLAMMLKENVALPVAIGAVLLGGGLVGSLNGFVIARLGINALITTLATMQIVRGLAFILPKGQSVGISHPAVLKFGSFAWPPITYDGRVIGINSSTWLMIGAFLLFGFLLNRTIFGRNALAIGGNPEAADLAGIPVARHKIIIFAIQGVMAAVAGLAICTQNLIGDPKAAEGLELEVISACVLGGVSLSGGVASMSGVVTGVLLLGLMSKSMDLLQVDSFWQKVATGLVLLAAVILDRVKNRR